MSNKKFLVVGATGHVGSKVAVLLADGGHDVTALVRRDGATIRDPHNGVIRYVTGDLADEASIRRAVTGIDVVVSTANGVVPQGKGGDAGRVNEWALRLIDCAEQAGVRRFVQSSVPPYRHEHRVPELLGKRKIEERLRRSPLQTVIVRNPAFMDVWVVMGGLKEASDRSAHATTAREYGFGKFWLGMVGNLVEKYGVFFAPGGATHGSAMIATRDVAQMLVGGALYAGTENLLLEAGGPEWLTWRQIADTIATKTGRKRVRVIPIPSWFARLNQRLARPFSAAVSNTFGLLAFVADHQPRWDSSEAVRTLGLPPQWTLSDYLDHNYAPRGPVHRPQASTRNCAEPGCNSSNHVNGVPS